MQNPEGSDPQKNVLVQVEEAKRYTFTYGAGLEFETGLPSGASAPAGATGVSPRVGFDVTRLNMAGRNQTLTFQSHVGRLQQRGLISYQIPKLFNNDRFKIYYTVFYDNSLDVATFTSQRWKPKSTSTSRSASCSPITRLRSPIAGLPAGEGQRLRFELFACRIQPVFSAGARRWSRLYFYSRQTRQPSRKHQGPILHAGWVRRIQLSLARKRISRANSRAGFHLLRFRPRQTQICIRALHHPGAGAGVWRYAGFAAWSLFGSTA